MIKFVIAILAVLGCYLSASMFWKGLFKTAFMLDIIPINGVEIISFIVFVLALRK